VRVAQDNHLCDSARECAQASGSVQRAPCSRGGLARLEPDEAHAEDPAELRGQVQHLAVEVRPGERLGVAPEPVLRGWVRQQRQRPLVADPAMQPLPVPCQERSSCGCQCEGKRLQHDVRADHVCSRRQAAQAIWTMILNSW